MTIASSVKTKRFFKQFAEVDLIPELTSAHRQVLNRILHYAERSGCYRGGEARLARELHLHPTTVSRAITRLKGIGKITVIRRGLNQTNLIFPVNQAKPVEELPRQVLQSPKPAQSNQFQQHVFQTDTVKSGFSKKPNHVEDHEHAPGKVHHGSGTRMREEDSTPFTNKTSHSFGRQAGRCIDQASEEWKIATEIVTIRQELHQLGKAPAVNSPIGYAKSLYPHGLDRLKTEISEQQNNLEAARRERAALLTGHYQPDCSELAESEHEVIQPTLEVQGEQQPNEWAGLPEEQRQHWFNSAKRENPSLILLAKQRGWEPETLAATLWSYAERQFVESKTVPATCSQIDGQSQENAENSEAGEKSMSRADELWNELPTDRKALWGSRAEIEKPQIRETAKKRHWTKDVLEETLLAAAKSLFIESLDNRNENGFDDCSAIPEAVEPAESACLSVEEKSPQNTFQLCGKPYRKEPIGDMSTPVMIVGLKENLTTCLNTSSSRRTKQNRTEIGIPKMTCQSTDTS